MPSKKSPTKSPLAKKTAPEFTLEYRRSKMCPFGLLKLDLDNPRLQTGSDIASADEEEVIQTLAEIAALDELITSICTNTYLNLEPLIVWGENDAGPFKVLEGNRRVAAIKIILDPDLAEELGLELPEDIPEAVYESFREVLVHRVENPDDAREFIGFKHINGPQRWDAFAKAKYVTEWYRRDFGSITIDQIAKKMGDNNNTLRSYIYAVLALEQAEQAKVWSLKDRPKTRGRFGFSHLYTALQREEFQNYLGMSGGWSNKPKLKPISPDKVERLGEVLGYIYGSVSDGRESLIKSQNPDLKDIGAAIASNSARIILQNRGTLDDARDALKSPVEAFHDALVSANIRLKRAVELLSKYRGGDELVESTIAEIFDQAEMLKVMAESRTAKRSKKRGN